MPESPVRKVTIFVSSPVDVTPERGRVQAVVAKLNREYEGLVRFETVLWEDQFYTADKSFQPQITEAVACDVVISIFWTRIGTELPADFPRMPNGKPYPSGTAYELLTALEASKAKAVPDVYVFRKTADAVLSTADVERRRQAQSQLDAMETFWSEWFKAETGEFKAAFQSFPSTDTFEEQVELLLRQWLQTRGLLGPRLAWPKEKGSPFRGLAPFEAEHAAVFFGRARMIDEARRSLVAAKERGTPFLLIVGASGSGKSSLARAGLLPRLTTPGVVASIDVWRVAQMKPSEGGAGPLVALAAALFESRALPGLMQGDYPTPAALADNLRRGGEASIQPILRAIARVGEAVQRERHADRPMKAALVLLVDQFEELFALGVSEAERSGFVECLKHLVASGQVWCVATMRADLYEFLLREPVLKTLKETGAGLDLGPPGPAELAEIVRAPAQAAGLVFERDAQNTELDERLLADAETADSLPLLQFTLHQLYDRRVDADGEVRLTHAAYDALGGLQGAIAAEAEQAVSKLPAASLDTLPRLLRRLAEPARDANALTLREAPQAEASADRGEAALVDALLRARILIARSDTEKRPTIRLAHNAVLASWPRAASAAQASRAFYRVRSEVEDALRRWQEHGRPKDRLIPTGVPLAEADKLVQSFGRELPPELTDYVSASRHRARTRQRWLATAAVFFFLLAIVATGTGFMAYSAQQEAVLAEARAIAERNRATRNFEVAQHTAERLVFDIAQGRNLEGMSAQAVRKVLETASAALETLAASAPDDLALQRSRAAALDEFAGTYETLGDLAEALKTRRSGVAIMERLTKADPANDGWQRDLSFLYSKVGDVLMKQGKLDEALASYRDGFTIAERLALADPANTDWQRNLSSSSERIAVVLTEQDKFDEALKAHRDGLAIRERLIAVAPDNTLWQRDLMVSHNRIGDVLVSLGKLDDALAAYREGLAIVERLAVSNPSNTQWQSDLSASYDWIGNVLMSRGEVDDALKAYRDSLGIRQRLAATDRSNVEWQSDLSASYGHVGDVLSTQLKFDEALKAYRDSLVVIERLAASDPSNIQRQRERAWFQGRIGDVLAAQGKLDEALKAYRERLAIREQVVAADRSHPGSQHDFAVAYIGVATVLETQGKLDEALEAYRNSFAIRDALAVKDPDNAQRASDQAWLYEKVGDLLRTQGKLEDALKAYRDGTAFRSRLAAADPGNADRQRDLALSYDKIANVLETLGRLDEAIEVHRNGVVIRDALAVKDPGNTQRASDQVWSYEKVGDLLKAQGKLEDALKAYRDGAVVRARLAAGDPGNADRQRDLALLYDKIAGVLATLGKLDETLSAYRDGLAIRERLAGQARDNIERQSDMAWSHDRVGDVLKAQGKFEDALKAYRDGLAVRELLVIADRHNPARQRDLALSYDNVGDVLIVQRELAEAFKAYREGLKIRQGLVAAGASDPSAQVILQDSIERLGGLSYRFILVGDFAKGLEAIDQALSLAPSLPWLYANRAHALMFLGRQDEARALYLQYRGTKNVVGEKSWDSALMEDFAELRGARLAHPLMDEIEKRLAAGG